MQKNLLKYMIDRYNTKNIKHDKKGPVVTISRDYGCAGNIIARRLIEEIEIDLSAGKRDYIWQWINKEILELSAKKLDIPAYKIEQLSTSENKGLFSDIITSFGQHYSDDKTVKKTLLNVISSYTDEGHVIIVGRGGVSIARDIKRSIHVSLQAPLNWRVSIVSKKRNMPISEVEKITKDFDHKRKVMRDYYFGGKTDNTIFDIVLNTMTLTEDEIVFTILELMKIRKFI